jgi:hypothetical protein
MELKMDEEQFNTELGEFIENQETHEPESKEEALSPVEVEAREMGYKSKEDFIKEGRDPEAWVSPKEYVRWKKHENKTHEQINKIRYEAEESKRNLKMLHDQILKQKIDELTQIRDQKIDYADREGYNAVQKQIDNLQQPPQLQKDPLITSWEEKNPWIFDKTNPKTQDALVIFRGYAAANETATTAQALAYVEDKLNSLYPNVNERRDRPTTTEKAVPVTSSKKTLSWDDLTNEELKWNRDFGHMFKDKKAFLIAVAEERKLS